MFQRKILEAYYIVLGKPTLSEQLQPDRLNLFRNGVTWLHHSVNILTLKYLFSGVLILNSTITFSKSDPSITFFDKFGPLLEVKLGTKGIWWCWFRDRQLFFKFCAKLIQCLLLFFEEILVNETQYNGIFKSANSGHSFSTRFFYKQTSEPHCCVFLKWNLRKCKPHAYKNMCV